MFMLIVCPEPLAELFYLNLYGWLTFEVNYNFNNKSHITSWTCLASLLMHLGKLPSRSLR